MNLVLTFLSENWRRLHLEQFGGPSNLSCVLGTPRFRASRHVIFFILANGSSDPILVAKLPRLAGDNSRLERETSNLRMVQVVRGGGFDSIPRVVSSEYYAERRLLIETALVGHTMSRALARRQPECCIEAVLAWLIDLHLVTAERSEDIEGWFGFLVERPFHYLENTLQIFADDERVINRSRELTAPLGEAEIPLVFEHGDLSSPNILIQKHGGLGVLDWELAEPRSLPAGDLFFFLTYVAFARRRAWKLSEYLGAFREAFFGPTAWARPFVTRYAENLQLSPALLKQLFVVCWSRYLANLVSRLYNDNTNPRGILERETADWLKGNRYYALWRYTVQHAAELNLVVQQGCERRSKSKRDVTQAQSRTRVASVALVGADGAGKTTIARMLQESASLPVKYIYMGINIEASNFALPTSRFLEILKRFWPGEPVAPRRDSTIPISGKMGQSPRRGKLWAAARVVNRLIEEWYRQSISWYYQMCGYITLYDRHFLFDFPRNSGDDQKLPLAERVHRWCLDRFYPRPDLVIFLDAPAEVLFARKGEWNLQHLESRRQAFIRQGKRMPNFVQIDATQPLERVYDEVTRHIMRFEGKSRRAKISEGL